MRAVLLCLIVSLPSLATLGQSPVEVYRRITPIEATTGVASIGRVVSVWVDVPEKETSQRFSSVYRLDFAAENRFMTLDAPLVDREPRGTIYFALSAEPDDERAFDRRLRESLTALGAASFDAAFAGIRPAEPPFNTVAAISVEPSWACFEPASGKPFASKFYRTEHEIERTDRVGISTHTGTFGTAKKVDPLCESVARVFKTFDPEEIRTMSTPRLLVEHTLSVDVVDMLPEQVYGDQLVPLPEGARLDRRRREGVLSSTSLGNINGAITASRAVNEVEIEAAMTRAALPVAGLRETVWHARWSYRAVERRMGPRPEDRDVETWSVTVSLMPTVPPRDLDAGEAQAPPDPQQTYATVLDEDAWFDSVAEALDDAAELTPEVLANAIVERIDGLGSGGWILTICMPDGGASWGLPPTTGRPEIVNAREFCATVDAALP